MPLKFSIGASTERESASFAVRKERSGNGGIRPTLHDFSLMAKNPETFETAFDSYGVVGVIGEGGAGRVFEVKASSGTTLALKCLRPELASSEKRKRFKNEIDFCSKNEHPNLIHVLDWGIVEFDGKKTPFYVMPKFAGTLRGLMEKKIPSDAALPAFGQVLDGVEAAHLLGVTHRDLKPENILYDPERQLLVVADLGIAHFEEEILATAVATKKGEKLPNIGYSAPEQRAKGAAVDKRADIYALGQILNEMFTGSIPEGAGYATIAGIAPQFAYLDALVEKMRQQNPAARPASIADVKKELIGRKNEFIALQELSTKTKEVVRTAAPGEVEQVTITNVNWAGSTLTLTLNRSPEPGWIQRFWHPMGNINYLMGLGPTAYRFQGNTVVISAAEQHAQNAIDQFKSWCPGATMAYQADVLRAAEEAERLQRKQLEQEIAQAEAKARVTSKLRF